MNSESQPRMLSIREVAATGILSEYALRKMDKEGTLPCIRVGKKRLVNLDLLIKKLNSL